MGTAVPTSFVGTIAVTTNLSEQTTISNYAGGGGADPSNMYTRDRDVLLNE